MTDPTPPDGTAGPRGPHDTPGPGAAPATLAVVLRQAAAELALQQPPPAVLQAAQQALAAGRPAAARGAQRGPALRWPWAAGWAWAGAATCAVLLGAALLLLRAQGPPPAASPPLGGVLLSESASAGGDFLALLPRERWPAEALHGGAPGWLVPAELPAQRLAALGLPFDPARAGDSVRAELLVHPSGAVLAVRLVP
jgi:hypothetical protein